MSASNLSGRLKQCVPFGSSQYEEERRCFMNAERISQNRRLTGAAIGLALLASTANTQETEAVTATATYRERIALPPDAIFEATLEDVSKPGAPATMIGRTRLEKPGQPPFRFSIQFDPAQIVEGHSYSLRARVTAGGKLMFITDQSYPVLTRGHGSHIAMMMMRRVGGTTTMRVHSGGKRSMRGMFRYMADAATFTDCLTGQRWPVAMEGDYKTLEAAYLKNRRQSADGLLATLEGQVAMKPGMEGGQPTPTLVVERYIGIWPGETCGAPQATSPLLETYWKLTRLGDQPVIVAEKQHEPSLIFRTKESRVTGFGGCNNLTGIYALNGNEVLFSRIAATRRACLQGTETEGTLLKALARVRTWKILGQHLELYDAGGNLLARFEARALK
jgi:uncharacterized lipoprotein YbaY/heat shock protein HslJ